MLMYGGENCAINRSERRKGGTAEMCFLRRVSVYALADHVCSTTIQNALQIYALEERIQACRNKWHNYILRVDSFETNLKEISKVT